MNLRYRLFLSFGLLFVVALIFTFWMESHMTSHDVKSSEEKLKAFVLELSEKKRGDFERFIADAIAIELAKIDVLLQEIEIYPLQAAKFAPTQANLESGTWTQAASLLLNNKFLNFVQNTSEGKLTSLIVLTPSLEEAVRLPVSDYFAWVTLQGHSGIPYVGVKLSHIPVENTRELLASEEIVGMQSDAYVLFPWTFFLKPPGAFVLGADSDVQKRLEKIGWTLPWNEQYQVAWKEFFVALEKTRAYLTTIYCAQADPSSDSMSKWITDQVAAKGGMPEFPPSKEIPYYTLGGAEGHSNRVLHRHYDLQLMTDSAQFLVWGIAAADEMNLSDKGAASSSDLIGITIFSQEENSGHGIYAADFFFNRPFFDDADYYAKRVSEGISNFAIISQKEGEQNIADSIAVIQAPSRHQIFLGNTAKLMVNEGNQTRTGYLTVGVDGELSLDLLALMSNQSVFAIHDGKIFSAISEEGNKIDCASKASLDLPFMLEKKLGTVQWQNEAYFFLHLTPFEGVDLHYLLLTPEAKEFASVHEFEQGVMDLVNTIIRNMRVAGVVGLAIVLVLLEYFSRKITRPITSLAKATEAVIHGRLEDLKVPSVPPSKSDEVAILCQSFEQMVKGLREKEKVKGILNKVVSQEIASEILKGNIHLGGEEKKATMLFADIRGFTSLTQTMPPQQVIELLNACMTRISHLVDDYGGVIDKYVGDEAMALYGIPISKEDSALKAVQSAIKMVESLKVWNQERSLQRLPAVEMGIGIHSGNVFVGNMGAENRLNYTAIGSNVNLAERLCALAKGMEILISEQTYAENGVKERIEVEKISDVSLKGFDMTFVIYRVKGLLG